ncbi:Equistatin [Frankliniella fusca]|uniref:Equistatin n=1 Tax=Frankliniella fusca TaxID=407009 RepID=A0AAE1LG68_9NEOP|nr:Equistatin [Frankliniella fusca]
MSAELDNGEDSASGPGSGPGSGPEATADVVADEEGRPATMCEYLRDFRDKMEGTRDGMSLALPPPSCRPDGSFNDTQCAAGECWCVDSFGTEIPRSRTAGAPSPACSALRESLDCLDLTCRLGCEFGFTLSPDTRCPLCVCRDPCAEAKCGPNAECHVVDVACDAEYCPPVPACLPKKPGQCPYLVPVGAGSCDYQCRSDYNCNETAKCCSNGCGTQCMQPVVMTECQHRRAILQHESHESGIPAGKLWVPRCGEGGAYEPVQCHPGTGQCWCVDAHGLELPGTRTDNGQQPDCRARNAVSACPALRCDEACPHGHQLDARGCPTCRCRDPCQELQCRGEGEACRMVQVQCADPPCHKVPMCLPRRENPCLTGRPLESTSAPDGLFRCGPSGDSCPASHKCELSPLGEYAVCCPKPRDVCFEPVQVQAQAQTGACEPGAERWYFNPERNACQQVPAGQCASGAQHNSFPSKEMCNKVCPVLSQCERLREKNQKAADKYKKWTFIPRCSAETGAWLPLQCLTQVGVCWCVAPDGQPIKGTLTRDPSPSCPEASGRGSSRQARRRHDPLWPAPAPASAPATSQDPEEVVAKLLRGLDPAVAELLQRLDQPVTPEALAASLPASLPVAPERRTRCLALRDRAEDEASALQCDHHGGFSPTQCLPKDDPEGECWCVDEAGNQLANTTTFKRGAKLCLPTPIEAVEVSLGFLGEPGVVDAAAEPLVLEAVRGLLAGLDAGAGAGSLTRHENLRVTVVPGRAVATFSLHGPGKVDSAFHLEEMVKSGALSVGHESGSALVADITQSRFSHRAATLDVDAEDGRARPAPSRVIALQHREIVSESTVSEVTSYHTAILVLSAASAFVIVILAVLAALYRRRMIVAAKQGGSGTHGQDDDDDRFGLGPGNEPVYVVRLPSPPPLDKHGRVLGVPVPLGVPLAQEDIKA